MIERRVAPSTVAQWDTFTQTLVKKDILVRLAKNDLRCEVENEDGTFGLLPNSEPTLFVDDTDGEIIDDFTLVRSSVGDWDVLFVLTDSGIQVKIFDPHHIGNFSPDFAFEFSSRSEGGCFYFLPCDGGRLLVKSWVDESTWLIDVSKILELPACKFGSGMAIAARRKFGVQQLCQVLARGQTAPELTAISKGVCLYAFPYGIAGYTPSSQDPSDALGISESFFHPYSNHGSWEERDTFRQQYGRSHSDLIRDQEVGENTPQPQEEFLAVSTKVWACRDLIHCASPHPGVMVTVRHSSVVFGGGGYTVEVLLENEINVGIQGKEEYLYEPDRFQVERGKDPSQQAVHFPGRKFWTAELEKNPSVKGCRVWEEEDEMQVEIFYTLSGEENSLHRQRLICMVTPEW